MSSRGVPPPSDGMGGRKDASPLYTPLRVSKGVPPPSDGMGGRKEG